MKEKKIHKFVMKLLRATKDRIEVGGRPKELKNKCAIWPDNL